MSGRLDAAEAFGDLPSGLRNELVFALSEVIGHYRARRWEPASLNGGKLSEVVYTILKGYLDGGAYPDRAAKPDNIVDACRALERYPRESNPHSFRVLIPRMLAALYDVRNNRSVGHVGGDVDPNHLDSAVVVAMSKWIVAELVRVLHDLPIDDATDIVDALMEREVPMVWRTGEGRRVLDPAIGVRDQVLLLLYSEVEPVTTADLLRWTEYGNASRFRNNILAALHSDRLVEYDTARQVVQLSPTGALDIESRLASHLVVRTPA